jgi:stress response protein SCP2
MNSEIQSILIRRKSSVFLKTCIKSKNFAADKAMVGGIIGNFGSLGYVMSAELLELLLLCNSGELESFYKTVFPILQAQVGATYRFVPMYPNFPAQVANASDAELWINAIMHYFGDAIGERIMPVYEKEVRFPFCENTEPRFLGVGQCQMVEDCFRQILEAKSSPSVQDKQDIITFFKAGYINTDATIVSKETLAFVCAMCAGSLSYWNQLKTATDVLRVAVEMSSGDISLTKVSKFGKFNRSQRKGILSILNKMDQSSVAEDMKRFEGMWIRLGEKLHPAEYTNQFPRIAESFRKLRNGEVKTTNSKIEAFLSSGEWNSLLDLLKTRPGDFARRLNAVLSKATNKFAVIDAFRSVADKVSTPVLWQIQGYFKSRDQQVEFRNRLFLPKTPKALVSVNNLVPLAKGFQHNMNTVIEDALIAKYATLPELGKVWIDPACESMLIPSGNRSASTALRQVGRGSRFAIGKDKSTVRLLVYWNDLLEGDQWSRRVDLDLSAVMYDKDWNFKGQCSWTNLRSGRWEDAAMVHSGDETSAPNGASEFLDVNLDKLDADVAYIAVNVFCYTGQKLTELPIGFCGWMEREYAGSGEIYEPKSITGRCDLTADATSTCPMILDVANREIVWADMALTLQGYCQSTESTADKAVATAELISRMSVTKASLMDMFLMHLQARNGEIVVDREEADFVISETGDLSPFDVARIMSEWV